MASLVIIPSSYRRITLLPRLKKHSREEALPTSSHEASTALTAQLDKDVTRRGNHRPCSLRNMWANILNKVANQPWLVWLGGLSAGLRTKGLPVRFPVRAHTWVVGQVPSGEHTRGNHTLMFTYLPSLLSKNE